MRDPADVDEEWDDTSSEPTMTAWPPMPDRAWSSRARCRGLAPTVAAATFFPGQGDDTLPAKRLCARCPVLAECREYALSYSTRVLPGIWGGLSEKERRAIRGQEPVAAPSTDTLTQERLVEALEQLRDYPGRSIVLRRYPAKNSAAGVARMMNLGQRPLPAGRWHFEAHVVDGGSELYARYDGPDIEAEAS